jgi:hypothetical protein
MFMLKARRPKTFRDNASIEHSGQTAALLDVTVNVVRLPEIGGQFTYFTHSES